jgi:hypothetical protein
MKRFCVLWSLLVGAMDASTGLLLIFSPVQVLGLLRVAAPSAEAAALVSWIGAFVFSVGLSYGFALRGPEAGETVWRSTALTRLTVAVFLAVMIGNHRLSAAWVTVAMTDAMVAIVQIRGLLAGWWKEGGRG